MSRAEVNTRSLKPTDPRLLLSSLLSGLLRIRRPNLVKANFGAMSYEKRNRSNNEGIYKIKEMLKKKKGMLGKRKNLGIS